MLVEDGVDRGVAERRGATVIDGDGLVLAPGLVDLHAHLREPGFEHKETIETGTRAAAAGGYTAVCAMANTDPVTDNAAVIPEVRDLAAGAGICDVFPVGRDHEGPGGESLAEIGEMVEAGVRVFTDDGRCVPTARVLRNALSYAQGVRRGDRRALRGRVARRGRPDARGVHSVVARARRASRAEAEEIVVARDLALAR